LPRFGATRAGLRYSSRPVGSSNELDEEETLAPGTELGRYQIARLLGRGGMGSVYEAIHRDLKKRVAIKTLHPAVAAMPGARARFLREGEAASRIRHPNVVDVTDVATEGAISYLVMEYLEGEDLSALIARTGPLPVAKAVDLLLPVFAAIAVAHDEGVIHRDLKPENIFLARGRIGGIEPKVLDFGISKLTSSGTGNTLALTGTGASMGTPYYIAPEQVRSAAGVDARSDQYALGAILYECMTGRRAHQGETIYEVIRSVGEGSFPRPRAHRPDLPVEIEQVILRAMALDPARRFPSVRALGRSLLGFASPGPRAQWAASLEVDDSDPLPSSQRPTQAQVGQSPIEQSQPGGTVVFATPAPSAAGPAGSRPPANTTFGSSAAQIVLPARNRSSWLAGGVVVLGAVAVIAYLVTSPSAHHPRTPETQRPTENVQETSAAAGPSNRPARYRVSVAATPRTAAFDLDGARLGTGRIDEELPLDGTEHTLVVSAAGFVSARITFRDRAPAEDVSLDPIPAAPRPPEPTASTDRPSRSAPVHHAHAGADHDRPAAAPPAAGKPAPSVRRTENGAAIIDD
jgi:eukaryotic-like serine/threonine-protein kinase